MMWKTFEDALKDLSNHALIDLLLESKIYHQKRVAHISLSFSYFTGAGATGIHRCDRAEGTYIIPTLILLVRKAESA